MKMVWMLLAVLFGGLALVSLKHAVGAVDMPTRVGDIVMIAVFLVLTWIFLGHFRDAGSKSN